jgi:hypothetical protein
MSLIPFALGPIQYENFSTHLFPLLRFVISDHSKLRNNVDVYSDASHLSGQKGTEQ